MCIRLPSEQLQRGGLSVDVIRFSTEVVVLIHNSD